MKVKVNIVFYSMYGHIYSLAEAVAAGAREISGSEVELYQVPELVPEEALEKSGAKKARAAFAHIPIAVPEKLAEAAEILREYKAAYNRKVYGNSAIDLWE